MTATSIKDVYKRQAGCLVREIEQEGAFISSAVEGFQGCQISNEYIDAEKIENTKLRELIGVITQMLI